MKPSIRLKKSLPRAFSLIELLSVIALIGLLMALAVPAISALRGSGNTNSATFNVSLLLEHARSYALANNVHVWVGFKQEADALIVASVAGVTGSSKDIQAPFAFNTLTKPKRLEQIKLEDVSGFDGMASGAAGLPTGGPKFSLGGKDFNQLIEFGPSGGAKIEGGAGARWIQVGLTPVTGNLANDAAIQVSCMTGQVRIFRR